jgi:hypothetical protein
VIKSVFNLPHYTDRVPALLPEVEKQNPKAKNAKPEEFVDGRFSASSIKAGLSKRCSPGDGSASFIMSELISVMKTIYG